MKICYRYLSAIESNKLSIDNDIFFITFGSILYSPYVRTNEHYYENFHKGDL